MITPPGEGWPDGKPEWANGYIIGRRLDLYRWLVVIPLVGGRARLSVCDPDDAALEAY